MELAKSYSLASTLEFIWRNGKITKKLIPMPTGHMILPHVQQTSTLTINEPTPKSPKSEKEKCQRKGNELSKTIDNTKE